MTTKNTFMGWKDLVLTPLVWLSTLAVSAMATVVFGSHVPMSWLGRIAAFYLTLIIVTFVALKIIRTFFPIRPGTHLYSDSTSSAYRYNLYSFIFCTNLMFLWIGGLVPAWIKKEFYRLLGTKLGKGIIVISGRLNDPHLVSLGDGCVIGDGALLLCHAINANDRGMVVELGPITIHKNAVVGARSIVFHNVEIGEGAMVYAMSMVRPHTKIGPGEVWAGIPAKRIR